MSGVVEFLCVEDNMADVELLREGIDELGLPLRMHHVDDGEKALAFLERGASRPDDRVGFVLLDLNLPRKSGLEVLAELSRLDHGSVPPIIVFTTAARESDVHGAAQSLSVRILTKPLDFSDFLTLLERISEFARGQRTLDEL